MPVVVLHGGPGGGCSPDHAAVFSIPRITGLSCSTSADVGAPSPLPQTHANTTAHLLADIELIRTALEIPRWVVFGGSWGATLALAYTQAQPQAVAHVVLRGVFMGTRAELDWFYGGGAARFFPELWAQFTRVIPEDEHHDLITAYSKRLFSGDIHEENRFARAWTRWGKRAGLYRDTRSAGCRRPK